MSVSADSESSPVVGSSRKMAAAPVTRLMPTLTRRRSPPLMPDIAPSMSCPIRWSFTRIRSCTNPIMNCISADKSSRMLCHNVHLQAADD